MNRDSNKARDRRTKIKKAIGNYRVETSKPLLLIAETEEEKENFAQFLPNNAVKRLSEFNELLYYCVIEKTFRAHNIHFGVIPARLKLQSEKNKYLPLDLQKYVALALHSL